MTIKKRTHHIYFQVLFFNIKKEKYILAGKKKLRQENFSKAAKLCSVPENYDTIFPLKNFGFENFSKSTNLALCR